MQTPEGIEDEEEPKLKYQRMSGDVAEILKHDSATAIAAHPRFLALGTAAGAVYILDGDGNHTIRKFQAHGGRVNDLCIEAKGEYVASGGEDGKVVVHNVYSDAKSEHSYQRAVLAVALEPDYSSSHQDLVCGGRAGQLLLNSKGWFRAKETVLHSNEGPVHAIAWRGQLIAWANDAGVKLYDSHAKARISHADRPKSAPRLEQCAALLRWKSDEVLFMGWADTIKVGQIKVRKEWHPTAAVPARYMEITALIQLDYLLAGLVLTESWVAALAWVMHREGADEIVERPELHIMNAGDEMSALSSDALPLSGYEQYKAPDYRLARDADLYYILSPKEIVVARPRDADDHISWLLGRGDYARALAMAQSNAAQLRQHRVEDVGEAYLSHLLNTEQIQQAVQLIPGILGANVGMWERWILSFMRLGELPALTPVIPLKNPQLSPAVYEMVLHQFLRSEELYPDFLATLSRWPRGIYKPAALIPVVLAKSQEHGSDPVLLEALAKLYKYDKRPEEALAIYLRLGRPKAFALIAKYDLFDKISDKVVGLMRSDEARATALLVKHHQRVPVAEVVKQLSKEPALLHAYLHALFQEDPHLGAQFHPMQITLYAEYQPEALLNFLRQSMDYPLEKALKICEERHLWREVVFIMSRMGNNQEALQLIIEKIQNIEEAIDFVKQQNDEALWNDLIGFALNRSEHVAVLLENVGAHVDPIQLINRIPLTMVIPGLGERLVKIIADYNLQTSLREGCNSILKADCVSLEQRLVRSRRSGLRVEAPRCHTCQAPMANPKSTSLVAVFYCQHVYHYDCLQVGGGEERANLLAQRIWCPTCQSQGQRTARSSN